MGGKNHMYNILTLNSISDKGLSKLRAKDFTVLNKAR